MREKRVRLVDPKEEWDSAYSIGFLPDPIRNLFREYADQFYHELRDNMLVVKLEPAPRQKHLDHMVRVAVSENPPWYRELYKTRPHMKRQRSLRALDRIRQAKDPELTTDPIGAVRQKYTYVTLYREVIFEMLVFGYHANGLYLPADPRAQEFFEVEGIENVLEHPF